MRVDTSITCAVSLAPFRTCQHDLVFISLLIFTRKFCTAFEFLLQ